MRILIVSTDYLPLIGGVAQHVSELARALHRGGDEVHVITVDRFDHWRDLNRPLQREPSTADRPAVVRVPYVVDRSIRFVSGFASSRLSFARFKREVRQVAQEFRPEVIHWHALDLWRNGLWRGLPAARVWTNHTSDFITAPRSPALRRRYRSEALAADHIIAPSEQLRELTAAVGIAAERTTFLPNGVDPSRFRGDLPDTIWRARLALQPGEQVVLCPRRLDPKNGVLVFVEAAARLLDAGLSGIRFVVAGDASGVANGDYAREVLWATRHHPRADRFALLGAVDNRDIPSLYSLADLVVIPSFMEATSIAALEAMASARAIVATRVGGLPFLVRDGESGLLVPPGAPAASAEAMETLLRDPARRRAMGARARDRVEHELSWSAIADRTREIYGRAMRERKP